MARAVFLHDPASIYDDTPWERYDFPQMYLGTVRQTIGDWIVYYEPRKAHGGRGLLGYLAIARVARIEDRPDLPGRHYAVIEPGSYLAFDAAVPRVLDGRVMESMLEAAPGRIIRAGANQLAVRRLPDADFESIVAAGLKGEDAPETAAGPPGHGLAEDAAPFARPVTQRLLNRRFRDRAFRRQVLEAYGGTCAISGLSLRNGGGWMEVEAAHIRAVEHGGPDSVRNGLALSATLHRMFDRGLITVGDDLSLIVSENKVPREAQDRLFRPDRRLWVPGDARSRPHPEFLAWHRTHVFGGGDGSAEWLG